MRGRRRSRAIAVIVAGVVAAAVAGVADLVSLLPGLEQGSIVQRFERRGPQPAPKLLVVAIDDKTFSDTQFHWPFKRRYHAQAIDQLRRDGARVIVYDVQFTEQTTARDDNALIEAVDRAHNVVLATAETDAHGRTNVLGGEVDPARGRGAGGREQPARGPWQRPSARRVRARRAADAGDRRRREGSASLRSRRSSARRARGSTTTAHRGRSTRSRSPI